MDLEKSIELLVNYLEEQNKRLGFSVKRPSDISKDKLPLISSGEHKYIDFCGSLGSYRLEVNGRQLALFLAKGVDTNEEALEKKQTMYFDVDSIDEKELKSLSNEINQCIEKVFSVNTKKTGSEKMPEPVSKSAVRSGASVYDGNTLAIRLTAIYPELKEAYKENISTYGEFLPEEFFRKHCNEKVLETIKNNDVKEMKKLFKILQDVYDNGSNDTQSIVAVTVLGELKNNETLLKNASDYMDDDLIKTVLLVNKYLWSSSGDKLRKKIENPPTYKPKKKKTSFLQNLMGGGQNGGLQ